MRKAILDGTLLCGAHDQIHAYLKSQFDLPEWYGNNLDALYDCLTAETGTLEVLVRYPGQIIPDSYGARILETLCQAAGEVGGHIILEYDAPHYEEMDEADE